jgi:uncharacterized repeat protein (TIGR01451 family)
MPRGIFGAAVVGFALILRSISLGGPAFDFVLRGEPAVEASPGEPAQFTIEAFLRSQDLEGSPSGPRAWSMALLAAGCEFREVRPGPAVFDNVVEGDGDGFFFSEITADRTGAIIAAAPSLSKEITLDPANSPHHVATFSMEGTVPAGGGCRECTVAFVDGIRGSGLPVENAVTYNRKNYRPLLGTKCVRLCDDLCSDSAPIPVPGEGASIDLTLDECRPAACHRLEVVPGRPLVLSLTEGAGPGSERNAMYVRFGGPASPVEHDFAADRESASQRLVIPDPPTAVCNVYVAPRTISPAGVKLVLTARPANLAIEGMSARRGCPGHPLTATIRGGGFGPTTAFTLVKESGDPIPARALRIASPSQADVVFDIPAGFQAAGEYDLCARDIDAPPDSPCLDTIEKAVEIAPDCDTAFEVRLAGMGRLRAGRKYILTVRYEHLGTAELPAPLLRVRGPQRTTIRLAGDQGALPVACEGEAPGNTIDLLAVNALGMAGALSPGTSGEIALEVTSDRDIAPEGTFEVLHVLYNRSDPVGWAAARPACIEPADWETLWPLLSAKLGATWKDYVENLASLATRLRWRGVNPASALEAFRQAVREVRGASHLAIAGVLLDDTTESPLPGVLLRARIGDSVRSCAETGTGGAFALLDMEGGATYQIEASGVLLASSDSIALEGEDRYGVELRGAKTEGSPLSIDDCPPAASIGLPHGLPPVPDSFLEPKGDLDVEFINSWDPNEKGRNPKGSGKGRFLPPGEKVQYTIYFENTGTAPVQRVEIIDELMDSGLDPTTVALGEVRIADSEIPIYNLDLLRPDRRISSVQPTYPFTSVCDCQTSGQVAGCVEIPAVNLYRDYVPSGSNVLESSARINHLWHDQEWPLVLQVQAKVNVQDQRITWILQTAPPVGCAGDLPCELKPDAGFLLPNDPCPSGSGGKGRGEGYVTYTVKTRTDLPEGTKVKNRARIFFDENNDVAAKQADPEAEICYPGRPARPTSEFPADGSPDVNPEVILSWVSDCRAERSEITIQELDSEGNPVGDPISGQVEEGGTSFKTGNALKRDTPYRWTVIPWNVTGETCLEEPATWEFRTAPHQPPCAPRLASPPEGSCAYEDALRVTWTCDAGPDPVTYAVFRSPSPVDPLSLPPYPNLLVENDLSVKSAVLSGLLPGLYSWRVVAMDRNYPRVEIGTSSASGAFRICPPGAPGGLKAAGPAPDFTLSWTAASGATSYVVFVGPDPGASPTKLAGIVTLSELHLSDPAVPGEYLWRVMALNALHPTAERGTPSGIGNFIVPSGPRFRRGDATDDGKIDLSDPIRILGFLYLGAAAPSCLDAADVDDTGRIDLTDAINLLSFLYLGGEPSASPGPKVCGPDPKPDTLGCAAYASCGI